MSGSPPTLTPHLFKAHLVYALDGEQESVYYGRVLEGAEHIAWTRGHEARGPFSAIFLGPNDRGNLLSDEAVAFGAKLLLPNLAAHFGEFAPLWGERVLGAPALTTDSIRRITVDFFALVRAGAKVPTSLLGANLAISLPGGTLAWRHQGLSLGTFEGSQVVGGSSERVEELRTDFSRRADRFFEETEIDLISLDQF